MALEVETELFLRTIEDAGAIPSKSLLEMEYANMQAYLSLDRSTRPGFISYRRTSYDKVRLYA